MSEIIPTSINSIFHGGTVTFAGTLCSFRVRVPKGSPQPRKSWSTCSCWYWVSLFVASHQNGGVACCPLSHQERVPSKKDTPSGHFRRYPSNPQPHLSLGFVPFGWWFKSHTLPSNSVTSKLGGDLVAAYGGDLQLSHQGWWRMFVCVFVLELTSVSVVFL